MIIDVLSVQPDLLRSPLEHSIMKRAQDKGLLSVRLHDLRDFGIGPHRQVDDYQYGGGAGMVMMMEPLVDAFETLSKEGGFDEVIYLTPDGQRLDQKTSNTLSLKDRLLLVCGHYKGIDQRFRDHYITKEISIGDYVLSGGELPAAVLIDSIGRLIPGVLNDETSALTDSFQDGLLAPPVYTRPADFNGLKVPDVLLSGHDARIEEWRMQMAEERTRRLRPDLLEDE
jgi:tRNA (guanine37-N1)-methyltransferase